MRKIRAIVVDRVEMNYTPHQTPPLIDLVGVEQAAFWGGGFKVLLCVKLCSELLSFRVVHFTCLTVPTSHSFLNKCKKKKLPVVIYIE